MKNNILTVAAALVVIIAMVGVTAAGENGQGIGGGCLSRNSLDSHTKTYDYLFADKTVSGTVVTYTLNTVANGALVIGYCVYPTPGFDGDIEELTPLYPGWEKWPNNDGKDYFGFERGNGGNEIPIDGAINIQVGSTGYGEQDKLPTGEVVLFHIKDPEECASAEGSEDSGDGDDDTCWRRPGIPQPPPVPEIATIGLVSTGIIGLFLVARKYRKN